jgi:20S proteasome subunit beta 5
MGVMIAGTDHRGPQLYYCDNDGNRMPGHLFSVGSGSTYAYGILDSYYKWDLTDEQAVELGVRAISEATHHDAGSGGVVRVYHIHKTGWTRSSRVRITTRSFGSSSRAKVLSIDPGRANDVEGKLL